MAVTRTDTDLVYGPDGQLISSTPVVRDVTATTNRATLIGQAQTALANNTTYLAIGTPTTPQAVAQVRALTVQNNKIIRLLLVQLGVAGALDDTN